MYIIFIYYVYLYILCHKPRRISQMIKHLFIQPTKSLEYIYNFGITSNKKSLCINIEKDRCTAIIHVVLILYSSNI